MPYEVKKSGSGWKTVSPNYPHGFRSKSSSIVMIAAKAQGGAAQAGHPL